MINLLPPDNKKDIRAGYANVIIVRYLIIVVMAFGILAAMVGIAYVAQSGLRAAAQDRVAKAAQSTNEYKEVLETAENFRSNLATAKQILDNELKYSKLMLEIAASLPDGVYLDGLSLDAESLGTPTTLSASAKTIADAKNLKTRLENNEELFSDVHFQSITPQEEAEDGPSNPYPIKISIAVTIKKDAL